MEVEVFFIVEVEVIAKVEVVVRVEVEVALTGHRRNGSRVICNDLFTLML